MGLRRGEALGLRRGEALGLRWTDVDLETRSLTVSRSLVRISGKRFGGEAGELEFVEPKSARSVRAINLPDSVAAALRALRIRQTQKRLLAGSR